MRLESDILAFAEKMTNKSPLDIKHCCVITTRSGRILSYGLNKSGRHGYTVTRHAELNAFHNLKGKQCLKCEG